MAESLFLDPAFRGDVAIPTATDDIESTSSIGRWPDMLVLETEVEERLEQFLDHEIFRAMTERNLLVDDWSGWQNDYWATPATKTKNFPFKGAANIVIPVTAIATEAIHARLMNTLFSQTPFWSIRPKHGEWLQAAKPIERWLQEEFENANSLDGYKFCSESLMELIKLGTGVGKSGYEKLTKKTNVPTGLGGNEPKYVTVKNGATLDYVPLANWLIRVHETDPQNSQWVGEEHKSTWTEMKRMALSNRIDAEALDKIKHWFGNRIVDGSAEDYHQKLDKLASTEITWHEEFQWFEIWLAFDVDGDGIDEEIVVDFHRESRTILSIRYNWYEDMHRPYRVGVYFPVEGRIYGIGIGKQNEQFQEEITTIHRQRLDNATIANMRMFAIKKTSGYGPGEPIFPGKMFFLDDPSKDIQSLQVGEIYQSSVANEEIAMRQSQMRTGANEVILGLPQQGTPGTATGDLVRQQEGTKKFDLVLKNVRRWYGLLGQDVIANFQQFGDQDRHWFIEGEKGEWVERLLQLPGLLVTYGAIVELTVSDTVSNRSVERQEWLQIFQLLTTHYGQALNLSEVMVQLGGDPKMMLTIAQRALMASDEAIMRVLSTYNEPNSERFTLGGGQNGQSQIGPGGNGGPSNSPQQAGVESVPQGATPVGSANGGAGIGGN